MKKVITILFCWLLMTCVCSASPFLVSDRNETLEPGSVFQLMVDGVEQNDILQTVDNAVHFDVQAFEGQRTIRVRYGNPWPDLPNTYKWSEWSEPFTYNFPTKPTTPSGCSIK